ncbi:bile acid:sodium symporter family protein [Arcanobacterium bovis]|uniref:Bile acid:sodium symporter n=1 Tax=Arcanobacterium bovis TaxID=2529275 RepID=A0A4Q9V398_9ACTO|nr:bile acid:sodium symporter family protein [Arcanobacterium bovis]TBW22952.1 bile acid:sodium symporter [Arcanobacterium bovis]
MCKLRGDSLGEILVKFKFDFLVSGIIVAFIIGIVFPVSAGYETVLSRVGDAAVALVFLFYGMRLHSAEVLRGLRDLKLQLSVLASTYVVFPICGMTAYWLLSPIIGESFALGIFFLSLLPSTVQSSVTFVSIARGDVAGAVCAATISNILGIFLTPFLVFVFMGTQAASTQGFSSVLIKLLLPFAVGQLLQPFLGELMRKHRAITKVTDNLAIIIVVFSAVTSASNEGVWTAITAVQLIYLVAILAVLLALMLLITWLGGKTLKFAYPQRVVLLMCGSKKSLASGLPIAKALFAGPAVATLVVPVILFHQIQLFVCAIIARRLAQSTTF